jgi:hypothetical protein
MREKSKDLRVVIGVVFAIVVLTGGGCVLLALSGVSGPSVESTQSLLAHAFSAAVGALIGLIGGQNAA